VKIPFPENIDPQNNVIAFKRPKREESGTIKPVSKTYESCKHESVYVDEGKREVTCQACKAILDAFQVLYEMALKQRRWLRELDEWEARRDSMLSHRYDEQWAKEKAEISSPPTDPETLLVWETFRDYFKGKFVAMYSRKMRLRNGPQWYGRSNYGGTVSFEYARQQLVQKLITPSGK